MKKTLAIIFSFLFVFLLTGDTYAGSVNPVSSTTPVVTVFNPKLELGYSSRLKRAQLTGSADVFVVAPKYSDVNINYISPKVTNTTNGTISYTNNTAYGLKMTSGATKIVSGDGNVIYKIPAGQKAKFTVSVSDNPNLMFAGVYNFSLNNITTAIAKGDGTYEYQILEAPATKSANLVIVGEKGPYISDYDTRITASSTSLWVSGNKFGNTAAQNTIIISGVNKGGIASSDGTTLRIPTSWFGGEYDKGNGIYFDSLQISNPTYGKSNSVSIEVEKAVKSAPSISMVRGILAGDFEIDSNGKFSIEGANLAYIGKDTRVFVGDREATVTQYGGSFIWVTAPSLSLGTQDLYVTTSYGESNIVKVKVITSSSDIDLNAKCPATKFDRDLTIGSSGNDVVALQTFLYSKGYLAINATGYFSNLTKAALSAYQVANNITSTGFFGSLTRTKMTSDCAGLVSVVTIEPTLVSVGETVNQGVGSGDIGTFNIKYKIKAIGGDVYIPTFSEYTSYIVDKGGVAVASTTGMVTSVLTDVTDYTQTANGNYKISEGSEEAFELVTTVVPKAGQGGGMYKMALTSINWSPFDGTPTNSFTDLAAYKTSYKYLNSAATTTSKKVKVPVIENSNFSSSSSNSNSINNTSTTLANPTASLTGNGSKDVTVKVGEKVTYVWTSSNANIFSSNYTSNKCGKNDAWAIKTKEGSITSSPMIAGHVGCVYNMNYVVKDKTTGKTAKDTVVVRVVKK